MIKQNLYKGSRVIWLVFGSAFVFLLGLYSYQLANYQKLRNAVDIFIEESLTAKTVNEADAAFDKFGADSRPIIGTSESEARRRRTTRPRRVDPPPIEATGGELNEQIETIKEI